MTGAGRGLGAALTLDLLKQGATVVALSRQYHELDRLKSSASEQGLEQNLILEVGSSLDDNSTLSAISKLNQHGCDLNLLLANAAVFGPRDTFIQSSPQEWEEAVISNILGLSRSCRASIPALKKANHAQVVVIGSAIGHHYSTHATAYAVSKAMAWSLVKCLSAELAPSCVAVNEWIPGPLHTLMNPSASILPVCREPNDPLILSFLHFLCQMRWPMPTGQSFSLRSEP